MANTGRVIVLTLQEVTDPGGVPTGDTKNNVIEDPDYIAPYEDLTLCPIIYTTDCPTYFAATGLNDSIIFEFSLDNAVVDNPALGYIKLKFMIAAVEQANVTFPLPNSPKNYFSDTKTGLLSATSYDLEIDYLSPSTSVVATCNLATTITTT